MRQEPRQQLSDEVTVGARLIGPTGRVVAGASAVATNGTWVVVLPPLQPAVNLTLVADDGAGPPPVLQPEDLNTDGVDPSGSDVWIHDSFINNDDDSIAVKPCTFPAQAETPCATQTLSDPLEVIFRITLIFTYVSAAHTRG